MFPILQIGPLALPLPGLLWIAGLWLGLTLAEKAATRFNIAPNELYNLAFIAALSGLAGGRLGYVAQYPAIFAENPLSIFGRDLGAFDLLAGLVTAGLALLVYGQRKKLPLWPTLDALTPVLLALAVTAGLANLASGAGFGLPTALPWGIELFGARRHPTQIYETLAALSILVWLWPLRRTPAAGAASTPAPGVYFLLFIAATAFSRLFLEAFRGDSVLLFGALRQTQVAAWLALAGALWLLPRRALKIHE